MKKLFKSAMKNKKKILTVLVAFVLYTIANSDGYGLIDTLVHVLLNGFVFYVAAKSVLRTAGSKSFFKGKRLRLVFEEKKEEPTV